MNNKKLSEMSPEEQRNLSSEERLRLAREEVKIMTPEEKRKLVGEVFHMIAEGSRKHPVFPKGTVQCNQCAHRIPATAKCSLLYPTGIPHEILSKGNCKEFKQK